MTCGTETMITDQLESVKKSARDKKKKEKCPTDCDLCTHVLLFFFLQDPDAADHRRVGISSCVAVTESGKRLWYVGRGTYAAVIIFPGGNANAKHESAIQQDWLHFILFTKFHASISHKMYTFGFTFLSHKLFLFIMFLYLHLLRIC